MRPKINRYLTVLQIVISAIVFTACEVDPIDDPNNPNANTIGANATLGEIQNLVTGTESAMRDNLNNYYDAVSVIGREIYRFSSSDPRFTTELLGKGDNGLDNEGFYIENPYGARYRAIRNANILIDALTNTKAVTNGTITEDQRKAGIAYAKTIQAHQLLLVFNMLYNNGIRVDVKDPDKLGPFLTKQQSLDAILNLLNEANTDLKDKAANLPFNTLLSFLDPPSRKASDFSKFNRALAARVAVYKEDWATANTALSESFLSLTGDLKTGVYYRYSVAGNDQLNTVFFPLNSKGEVRLAHPSFVGGTPATDLRLSKVSKRTVPETSDGLTSEYDFYLYKTNVDPIPIIRNEELILLYAEVKAQLGTTSEAVAAINQIRNAAGIGNYTGATDKQSLITEILNQRRYSLFGEGHRWIDMRRYNLLSQLPIDRPGDDVWVQFPIPASEPK